MIDCVSKFIGWSRLTIVPVVVGSLLLASAARAQTNEVSAEAESLYREALGMRQMAEETRISVEARDNFKQAIANCDAATKSQPDFFKAQALAAHCAYRLAELRSADNHSDLVKSARDRFALAALCTGAGPALYCEWGEMLVTEAGATVEPVARESWLREARRIFEVGLTPIGQTGERARVERALGTCLTILAKDSVDAADKRALLEEAIARFNTAAKVEAVANTPQLCEHWGVALFEYAKLTDNRLLLRQGVERLETALEKGAEGVDLLDAHYNLACAYALLGQADEAVQHLRFCLNHDDDKQSYSKAATRDPDLRSLEQVPEFNGLFKEQPADSLSSVVKPSLSDN